jgi:DNA (cytosine-5)-methyltransferase 1
MNNKLKFIDLFAGIGGFHLALHSLGMECVFASEIDKYARQTYKANFEDISPNLFINNDQYFNENITKIDPSEIPDFDILCAGFPCQPFSNAGYKKGFDDTRGTLFFNIAEIIRIKQPQAVFLENVRGLLNHDKGKTFGTIYRVLEELGYSVSYKLLTAKDFGLPQNRVRLFIVAFKGSLHFDFPEPFKIKTRLGDILEDSPLEKYTISDKLWAGHQRRKEQHKERGNGFGYSMFNQDSVYTSTISARYYKDGSEIMIEQTGKNPRKLTPREALKLQGYLENYKIVLSDNHIYKQAGNSVPVPVIKAIGKQILETINLRQKHNNLFNTIKQYEI